MNRFNLSLLIIVLLFALGCKKSSTSPSTGTVSSMSFMQNGTAVNFSNCVVGLLNNQTFITGNNNPTNPATAASLVVQIDENVNTLAVGQTFTIVSPLQIAGGSVINFSTGNNELFQSQGGQGMVTITDVTSDYIKGNFSVVLYLYLSTNNTPLNITNGTFVAKRALNLP